MVSDGVVLGSTAGSVTPTYSAHPEKRFSKCASPPTLIFLLLLSCHSQVFRQIRRMHKKIAEFLPSLPLVTKAKCAGSVMSLRPCLSLYLST